MVSSPAFAERYRAILDTCHPFIISFAGNLPALDLAPLGVAIAPEHIFCPTRTGTLPIVDALHHLDSFSFGPQDMLMPRWVLFDCGEFPGIVYGFGRYARDLSPTARQRYCLSPDADDLFVPLSMWVAIRCAEEGAWFGHNLSSANIVLGEEALPGLATLTKVLGVVVTKATRQYGATQWDSSSINIHLTLGELELLSAHTPAHTHEETFAYRLEVDPQRLSACLQPGWQRPAVGEGRVVTSDQGQEIRALHQAIEAGERWSLVAVRQGKPNHLTLQARGTNRA